MTIQAGYHRDTTGKTLYAFPFSQALADWLTYRVQLVETPASSGNYQGSLDDSIDTNWRIFEGATEPSALTEALYFVIGLSLLAPTAAANAAAVEAAILDEGDATALLAAISAKIETFLINEGDATATLAAIATAVRTNLATELSRIDVAVSTRNAVAPDNAGIAANGVAISALSDGGTGDYLGKTSRSIGDTSSIDFMWPSLGATVTGTQGDGTALVGAIDFLQTENGIHWYRLTYSAADRPAGSGTVGYVLTDGTVTKSLSLVVSTATGGGSGDGDIKSVNGSPVNDVNDFKADIHLGGVSISNGRMVSKGESYDLPDAVRGTEWVGSPVLTVVDSSGNAVDLTGASMTMNLKHFLRSRKPLMVFTTTGNEIKITDAAAGKFKVKGQELKVGSRDIPPQIYFYDIEATLADDKTHAVISGMLTVKAE